jgi:hypothetical protein
MVNLGHPLERLTFPPFSELLMREIGVSCFDSALETRSQLCLVGERLYAGLAPVGDGI